MAVVEDWESIAKVEVGGSLEPRGKADDEGGVADGGAIDEAGDLAGDAGGFGGGEESAVKLVLARKVDVELEEARAESGEAGFGVERVGEAILEAEVGIEVDGLAAGGGDGAGEVGGALDAGMPVGHGKKEEGRGRGEGGGGEGPGGVEVSGTAAWEEGVVEEAAVGPDELPMEREPVGQGERQGTV